MTVTSHAKSRGVDFARVKIFARDRHLTVDSDATPWDALAHQGKIGFSFPRLHLPLHFEDAKARNSSMFKAQAERVFKTQIPVRLAAERLAIT